MSRIHLLNVKQGDCTIFEHASGRVTIIDICSGNLKESIVAKALMEDLIKPKGNFRMCQSPTNPIDYFKEHINSTHAWRFILTHPDMDHLDGFNALANEIPICNFWDTGAKKEKPEFKEGSSFLEEDWDRYEKFRDGTESGTTLINHISGSKFQFANCNNQEGEGGGDGLYILAPGKELVDQANESGDFNDCSYVILYKSLGGDIIIAGDAHDKTWDYIIENHSDIIANCKFLLAPHHGRKSDREYEFLNYLKPELTLLGCAPSKYLSYDAYKNRGLTYITQNQCGNMVLETTENGEFRVFIENEVFAKKINPETYVNEIGYYHLLTY